MARTDLTVTELADEGVTVSLAAANADGHAVQNDGRTFVEILNGSGGSINVTAETPGTVDGLAIGDRVVAIGAGVRKILGPWKPSNFNQRSGADAGKVYLDFSDVTTVTVQAFRLPDTL